MREIPKVNRVEVIDYTTDKVEDTRAFVKWEDGIKVSYELQNDKRTLKIFIKPKEIKDNE